MKPYIIHYKMHSIFGNTMDHAIVFAKSTEDAIVQLRLYAEQIPDAFGICGKYSVAAIFKVEPFNGTVFTRLFDDDGSHLW